MAVLFSSNTRFEFLRSGTGSYCFPLQSLPPLPRAASRVGSKLTHSTFMNTVTKFVDHDPVCVVTKDQEIKEPKICHRADFSLGWLWESPWHPGAYPGPRGSQLGWPEQGGGGSQNSKRDTSAVSVSWTPGGAQVNDI